MPHINAKWSENFEVRTPPKMVLGSKVDFVKTWSIKDALFFENLVGLVIEGRYHLLMKLSR